MARIEIEDLPFLEDLPDEEVEKIIGASPLPRQNGLRQITLQTDTGEIL